MYVDEKVIKQILQIKFSSIPWGILCQDHLRLVQKSKHSSTLRNMFLQVTTLINERAKKPMLISVDAEKS